MKKFIFLFNIFLFIFLLQSCLEQNIVMDANNDMTGNVEYKLTLSKDYLNSYDYRDKIDSVEIRSFLNKDDIQKRISGSKNIKLGKYVRTDESNGEIYEINFKFTQIEDLKNAFPLFFVENSIYSEKDYNYCKARLVLNFLGDSKKIRSQYAGLNDEEKKLFSAYMSIITIKLNYVLPSLINESLTSKGILDTEFLKEYAAKVFENDISGKLDKQDKAALIGLFTKNLTAYSMKNYLSDEEIDNAKKLIIKSGFKNSITFERTLFDIVNSKEDPEFSVVYKKL
jgi:hypothetical protein